MREDINAVLISFAYIIIVILSALYLYQRGLLGENGARKLIHIASSLWIFAPVYFISEPMAMIIGPIFFLLFNSVVLAVKKGRLGAGIALFPLSLIILITLYINSLISSSVLISSVLVMGLGDGAAGVIGSCFGRARFYLYGRYQKSVEGTVAMAIVSLLVLLAFSQRGLLISLFVALCATGVELLLPFGVDNLTVPLITALLLEAL